MNPPSLRAAALALVLAPGILVAQTRTATAADTLTSAVRLQRAEAAIRALQRQVAEQTEKAPTPPQDRSRTTLKVSGRVLANGFFNSSRVNNVDNPQFADTASGFPRGLGGTIRHTWISVTSRSPDVLQGTFEGNMDADFQGGQLPSDGGRAFPLIRLRTATATLRWSGASLLLGQTSPLVGGLDPVSPTAIGTPLFANAGNLWQWLPQVRFSFERIGQVRFGAQAAALAPAGGAPTGVFDTGNDLAERTYRPFVQGRVYMRFGPGDLVSELGCGVHKGWLQPAAELVSSEAVACDAFLAIASGLDLRGEFFTGEGLNSLGGGAIGQNFTPASTALGTTGGWAQLNMRPVTQWQLGGGCGVDHPDAVAERRRNDSCAAYTIIRPSGPFFFGTEYRLMRTEYAAGRFTNHYVTAGAGFTF